MYQKALTPLVVVVSFVIVILSFQNCSDPKLDKMSVEKTACKDSDKVLFIQDAIKLVDTGLTVGENIQLQVYEEKNGRVELFTPEDANTEWPPRWYKNTNELPPAEVRKQATVNDTSCVGDLFEARFLACGEERSIKRRYFTGTCQPVECELNGVTARLNEERRFYRTSSPLCNESCDSMLRECVLDASGNPVFSEDNGAANYTETSCTEPEPCAPTPTPVPVPTVDPDIEPNGCTPEQVTQTTPWSSLFGSGPWPNFGASRRLRIPMGRTMAFTFTTTPSTNTSVRSGSFAYVDTPMSHEQSLKMYISKTAGCSTATSLHPKCSTETNTTVGGNVEWKLPNIASSYVCPLQFSTTYNLNLVCVNATDPSGECVFDFQNQR